VLQTFKVSERRVCSLVEQHRTAQRYKKRRRLDEERLREKIIKIASRFGRYGYRRVTALIRNDGVLVNHKRVQRIWRQEGLKVPQKQPKRGRLWLNDGSCVRHRAMYKNHVWSYDFVHDATYDGRPYKTLNIIDEFTRECLAIKVKRRMTSFDVLETLADLFLIHGPPAFIRSDNGPEFVAHQLRMWLHKLEVRTLFIEPGSPWENGYIESFNSRLRDELLNGEIFYNLVEAKVVIENWRREYNTIRPHSSLGYRPPTPVTILPSYEVDKILGIVT